MEERVHLTSGSLISKLEQKQLSAPQRVGRGCGHASTASSTEKAATFCPFHTTQSLLIESRYDRALLSSCNSASGVVGGLSLFCTSFPFPRECCVRIHSLLTSQSSLGVYLLNFCSRVSTLCSSECEES